MSSRDLLVAGIAYVASGLIGTWGSRTPYPPVLFHMGRPRPRDLFALLALRAPTRPLGRRFAALGFGSPPCQLARKVWAGSGRRGPRMPVNPRVREGMEPPQANRQGGRSPQAGEA